MPQKKLFKRYQMQDSSPILLEVGFVITFLGKDADDIDIATNADPDQIMQLFPKTIPVGINFSILIVVEDDVHCEVATFRTESGYEDGRRPNQIIHSTPEEDAKRRDFTINGMFYDPLKDEVFDFVEKR